ncbi:MAG: hypothetical protein F9K32_08920 [Desulfobulbaceae bacterium]|nr:MAG: hypothetical protein F9K32_08920 [Desulfobulbaceae bacterium]
MMAEFRPIPAMAAMSGDSGEQACPSAAKVAGLVADRAKIMRKFLTDRVLLMAFILINVSEPGSPPPGTRKRRYRPIAGGNQRVYANAKVCYSAAADRAQVLIAGIIVYSSRVDDVENDRALSFWPSGSPLSLIEG